MIDELREIVRSLSLLAPDHAMESLQPEALRWIEDRVESSWALATSPVKMRSNARAWVADVEERAIRGFFTATSAREYPQPYARRTMLIDRQRLALPEAPSREVPSVLVSRSMNAVFEAWRQRAQRSDAATVFDPVTMARSRVAHAYGSRDHLGFMLCAMCADNEHSRAKIQGGSLYAHPVIECAIDHLLWQGLFDSPSPLGPWIELWQRGLWPCWGDEATAHVFNPVRGPDGAMIEPEDERAEVPRFDGQTMLPLSHAPACAIDAALAWDGSDVRVAPLSVNVERLSVGRARTAEVALANATVARRHMDFERTRSRWWARDLNSTNGVVLRGEYARGAVALSGGELLVLGACAVLFVGSAV